MQAPPGPPPPLKPKIVQPATSTGGGLNFGNVQLKKTAGPTEISNADKIAAEAKAEREGVTLIWQLTL